MPLKYIIALHFDATCFADQRGDPYKRKSEIIKFPAANLNLETGEIESKFEKFIKPTERPQLSDFCVNMTGISQWMVDNGNPIDTTLQLFDNWLEIELESRNLKLPTSKYDENCDCAFVSWTSHDSNCFLRLEAKRKNNQLKPYFHYWIDLKSIFQRRFNLSRLGFKDALKRMDIDSDTFDVENIAKLAYKMAQTGSKLETYSQME